MSLHRCLLSSFLLASALTAPPRLMAQVPSLAPDSTGLFATFFTFHDDFSNWLDQRKAANAKNAQALDNSAAQLLRIDKNDLGNIRGVTNSVMADLRNIQKDWEKYANSRAKNEQLPDPAVAQDFVSRRDAAVQAGIDKLRKNLSPASWAGLRDYVNTTHRLRFRRATAPVK
jgi:hypothetical protein